MKNYIQAGEIHKQVQQYARDIILPGTNMMDIVVLIEDKIKELTHYNSEAPLAAGVAFPTGLSINNCAAHWTPNKKDINVVLGEQDLIKVDFGVHIGGCIVDGAISITHNEDLQHLVSISEKANALAIKSAGVDAYLYDIGCSVQEYIESKEITVGGQVMPLHSIRDLCGHQIGKYMIHVGKPVPNVRWNAIRKHPQYRMKAGEIYAVEPYPTTGSGAVISDSNPDNCSHYMANYTDRSKYNQATMSKNISRQFGTLAFCRRWLDNDSEVELNNLVTKGIYTAYPPLYSEKGTHVAQTEKTIYVTETGVQILN
jgi:methionyl aminopeptidase